MKPIFEELEKRDCPSGLTAGTIAQFGAAVSSQGIAPPAMTPGQSLLSAMQVCTPFEGGVLQAWYEAQQAPSPLTPVITQLPNLVVPGLPGQPSLTITNRIQLDYGQFGVLVSGDAAPVQDITPNPLALPQYSASQVASMIAASDAAMLTGGDTTPPPLPTPDQQAAAVAASDAAMLSAYFILHPNG